MSLETTMRVLERAPIFGEIGRDPTRLLAFSAEEMRLKAGSRLFERGTPAEGAFVLLEGRLRLVAGSSEPVEREVGPGTLIGEMALLVPTERPCDAFAVGDVHLLSVSRPLFRRMLEEFPELALVLRQRIAERAQAEQPVLDRLRATLADLER
jgi:CRP-like cAMP-binding protein